MTKIISGFPGIGKSFLFNESLLKKKNITILDSDSSKFSWIIKDGVKQRNPDFPLNYVQHIKENTGKVDYILVSSHEEIRSALLTMNIPFTLVYPKISCKNVYIERYKERGSPESFIELVKNNWDAWINALDSALATNKVVLSGNQYLSDILDSI